MMSHLTLRLRLALLVLAALLLTAPLAAAAQTSTPVEAKQQAEELLRQAQASANAGDLDAAIRAAQAATGGYAAADDAEGEVGAWFFLAIYYRMAGSCLDALEAYSRALEGIIPLRNALVEAAIHLGMGDCYAIEAAGGSEDFLQEALENYTAAAGLYRSSPDATATRGLISALNSQGNLLHRMGRYEDALASFAAGLPLARQLNDVRAELLLQAGTGNAQQALAHYDLALAAFTQAGKLARGLDDKQWLQSALLGMGSARSSLRQFDAALRDYLEGANLAAERGDAPGEAMLRMEAGLALQDLGRYAESAAALEQALALERAQGNRQREALALSHLAAALEGLGRNTEALDRYEAARVIAAELGDTALLAQISNNLGLLYDVLGRPGDAEKALNAALEQAGKLEDSEKQQATARNNLGTFYNHRGLFGKAQENYDRALAFFRALGSRYDEAITLNNIAQNYDSQGRYADAAPLYEQALALHRELGDRGGEATVVENLAGQDAAQGRYAKALERYEQALAAFRELGLLHNEAVGLSNLATLYATLGRYDEARVRYEQALALRRKLSDRAGEGVVQGNIAALEYEAGDYERALEGYRAAGAIAEETGDGPAVATWGNHRGAVLVELGRFNEAREAYSDALAEYREQGDGAGEAAALNGLGVTAMLKGNGEQAAEHFDAALSIYRELGLTPGEATTLANKAALLAEQGRGEEALDLYGQSLRLREQLRGAAPGEELRVGLTLDAAAVYDAAALLAVKLGRDADAFDLTERARARGLLDQLSAGRIDPRAGADADLLAREQALRAELAALEREARQQSAKPAAQRSAETVRALREGVTARQAEYDALLAEIKTGNPQYAAMVSATPLSLAELQANLPEDITIVSYFLGVDAALAFVVQHDRFETVILPVTTAQVWEEVAAFRGSFAALDERTPPAAEQLANQVIAPIAPYLTTPILGVVPHGPLHYLPFGALPWPGGGGKGKDAQAYLAGRFALFSLPSASVLDYLRLGETSAIEVASSVLVYAAPEGLPALQHAGAEAAAVASALGEKALITGDATESALREVAPSARVLHIIAHGQYVSGAPLFSRLVLKPDDVNDGAVEVHEIYGLDLRGLDLVTLSACQTNVGKLNTGDDVTGLSRAFFYAGARSIVASLWSVDDEATAALMAAFYRNLAGGMGKARALAQAQAAVRSDKEHPEWRHPYYWAAFVLNGDPGADSVQEARTSIMARWPWLAVAAIAALLAVALLPLVRRKAQARR